MATYYVLSSKYADQLDRLFYDEILDWYRISTEPLRTDALGQPCTYGWVDVGSGRIHGAHGVYPTLDAAREIIQMMAPGARLAEAGEIYPWSIGDDVVECWLPRVQLLRRQLDDWAFFHDTTPEIALAIALAAEWDLDAMELLSETVPETWKSDVDAGRVVGQAASSAPEADAK